MDFESVGRRLSVSGICFWRIRTCSELVERILPPQSGISHLILRTLRYSTGVPVILEDYDLRTVTLFSSNFFLNVLT